MIITDFQGIPPSYTIIVVVRNTWKPYQTRLRIIQDYWVNV